MCARAINKFLTIRSHEDEEQEEGGREFWAVSDVGLLALLIPSSTLFTSWERRGERRGDEREREREMGGGRMVQRKKGDYELGVLTPKHLEG